MKGASSAVVAVIFVAAGASLGQVASALSTKAPFPSHGVATFSQGPGRSGTNFPNIPLERIEGGSLKTIKLPNEECERIQMIFMAENNRPIRARLENWLGPQRRTHGQDVIIEDGTKTPYRSTVRLRKGTNTFSIKNNGPMEFPLYCGFQVLNEERNKLIGNHVESLWKESPKEVIQGGAVHSFPVPESVSCVQLLLWSVNVGKRSTRALVEVLQGPNNKRQVYNYQLGGSSQPYWALLHVAGSGYTVRVKNTNTLEFPIQAAVIPYTFETPPHQKSINDLFSVDG